MDIDRHQQFARLLVKNQNRVFGYIVGLVANRADAEEIFQQTCLTLWEIWDRYDPSLEFVPWACGIAHNHVRNFLKKKQNQQVALSPEVVEQLGNRQLGVDRQEDDYRVALEGCLGKLPGDDRRLVEQAYSGKWTIKQLAERGARTPNATYKLLRRIRGTLHDCITGHVAGTVG